MKAQYPDAAPEQYAELDEEFRRFMACGRLEGEEQGEKGEVCGSY